MLEFCDGGNQFKFSINNKLSFSKVSEAFNLSVNDGVQVPFANFAPSFVSTEVTQQNENILHGAFLLNNGMIISDKNAVLIQGEYLKWENAQLNRSHITFKLTSSRNDKASGISPYNPYFIAVVNKLARTDRFFDLVGFGHYLSERELAFTNQYCAFHPALRTYINAKSNVVDLERIVMPCKVIELLFCSALAHVEGNRDRFRFDSLYNLRGIDESQDDPSHYMPKSLMDYDHVLDAPSIQMERFDFFSCESSGGLLDLLNIPF